MSDAIARDPPANAEVLLSALEAGQREMLALVRTGLEKTDRVGERVDRLTDRVEKLVVDVAELRGRVSQLPTTVTMLGFVLAVLAMAGVLKIFVR